MALKKADLWLDPVLPEHNSLREKSYLLRLLSLLLHSFHCSDVKETGFIMERGFHKETHFAPKTKPRVSHGNLIRREW